MWSRLRVPPSSHKSRPQRDTPHMQVWKKSLSAGCPSGQNSHIGLSDDDDDDDDDGDNVLVMMGRCGRLGHWWARPQLFSGYLVIFILIFVFKEIFSFRPTIIMVMAAQAVPGPGRFYASCA